MIGIRVGTRTTEGVPRCSDPLQEMIDIIVPREQGKELREAGAEGLGGWYLTLWYTNFHSLHLAFPAHCCVAQRGKYHPVSTLAHGVGRECRSQRYTGIC